MTTLKGGISNNVYVWHASDNACEKCQSLYGKEFDNIDDIPDRPHPNCKCYIETVIDDECGCHEKIQSIIDEVDKMEGDILSDIDEMETIYYETESIYEEYYSLKEELASREEELKACGADCMASGGSTGIIDFSLIEAKLDAAIYAIVKHIDAGKTAYELFRENKRLMIENRDGDRDKFYHAKSNCEAAELGKWEAWWALQFSIMKEVMDFVKKVVFQKRNAVEIFQDCVQDINADLYGMQRAKEAGSCSEKVKDAPDILF